MADSSAASDRAIRVMHVLCLLLITHGSVYPWSFSWPARGVSGAWTDLLANTALWSGLGDVVGNVVLFAPLGVLSWLDLRVAVPRAAGRFTLVMCVGTLFAFLLQLLQFFVPERVPQLSDVIWNAAGLAVGVGAVPVLGRLAPRFPTRPGATATLLLVAFWLASEWWPLVPTIDWQHIKDALKPLLGSVPWSGMSFVEAALAVLAIARMLRGLPGASAWLALLAGAAVAGKLFIVGQAVSPGRLTGVGLGVLLGLLTARVDADRMARWLFVAVIVWLSVDGLRPFDLTDTPNTFHWIPFTGVLEGSLAANSLALIQVTFWVGVAMRMGQELGARSAALATALALLLLLIEGIQVFLPGRSADCTVVLVPWLWWLLLQVRPGDARTESFNRHAPRR